MSNKRKTDTELWNKDWFLNMPPIYMLFYNYFKDNCDYAGIWRPQFRRFELITGEKIDGDKALKYFNTDKERVIVLDNGKWFLKNFYSFHYGKSFNLNNNLHVCAFNRMCENGLGLKHLYGVTDFIGNIIIDEYGEFRIYNDSNKKRKGVPTFSTLASRTFKSSVILYLQNYIKINRPLSGVCQNSNRGLTEVCQGSEKGDSAKKPKSFLDGISEVCQGSVQKLTDLWADIHEIEIHLITINITINNININNIESLDKLVEEFVKFGWLEVKNGVSGKNFPENEESEKSGKKITRPKSEEECVEYFKSKGYYNPTIEGVKFFHYHNSKGWKIGKNPVVNWHSAAAYWNRNNMSKLENKKKYVEPNKGGRF